MMLIMILSLLIYYIFSILVGLILIKWSSNGVCVMIFIFRNPSLKEQIS